MIANSLSKHDLPKTKRRYLLIIVISFLALLNVYFIYFFLFGERGLVQYYQLKNQYDALSSKSVDLQEENQKLRKEIEELKNFNNTEDKECFVWKDEMKFCVFK